MVYVIFLCLVIPLAMVLPLLESRSRYLIGFMMIGAAIAVCSAEINSLIYQLFALSPLEISVMVAPISEELMKALPIFAFALLASDARERVLPLAIATGVGFAVLENCYILLSDPSAATLGWALLRGISASLIHSMSTFLVGCGILFIRKQKKLFYTGTFALLTAAVTLHSTFNLLITSKWSAAGVALPIVIYLVVQIIRIKQKNSARTSETK